MVGIRLAVGYPVSGIQRYNFYGYTNPTTSAIVHESFVTGAVFLSIPKILGWNWHAWSDRIYGDGSARGTLNAANFGFVRARDDINGFVAGTAWTKFQDPANAANGHYVSDVTASVYQTIDTLNGNSW